MTGIGEVALVGVVVLLGAGLLVLAALALFTARTARRVERALPPDGRFVEIDGARIHYHDRGTGPTLLLIHGLGGHARNFTYALVARLEREFRVVVMERPGSGYSTRAPGTAAGPRAQADTVAAFIRALDLGRPVLVGHSLGGAIALAVASADPELVGGLALIAPLTGVQETPPAAFERLYIRSPALRWFTAWTVATPLAIARRQAVLEALFAPDPVPPDFATAGGGMLGLRPRGFYGAATDLVAVRDDMPAIVERYASLQVPVGVLFGTGDRILDHQVHGAAMAGRLADVQVQLVEGGHMLPLTRPDEAAELVRDVARRAGALGTTGAAAAG